MANKDGGAAARLKQRAYISQADVPMFALEKALKVPSAIRDNYGYKATSPLHVAKAMEMQPSSSHFRMLTGAAIAYGLTSGGYNAEQISITPLGMRIVRPTAEGDDLAAKREALLKPRIIREFLTKYNGAPVPKENIAQSVLAGIGVPEDRTAVCSNSSLKSLGLRVRSTGKDGPFVLGDACRRSRTKGLYHSREEQSADRADQETAGFWRTRGGRLSTNSDSLAACSRQGNGRNAVVWRGDHPCRGRTPSRRQ